MQLMLTEKQIRVLRFFRDYRAQNGISPTLEEAARALGVSKITIFEHLNHLAEKGAVYRDRAKARSVAILYDPDRDDSAASYQSPRLPLCGTIAAGQPIDAVEDREEIPLDELIPHGDDCYLLRVTGKSMVEDHIDDGDMVIVQRQSSPRNGDIVVAIVDGEEATLKRFYRDNGRVRLQPANSSLRPIFPERVEIRGIVRGVIRRYH